MPKPPLHDVIVKPVRRAATQESTPPRSYTPPPSQDLPPRMPERPRPYLPAEDSYHESDPFTPTREPRSSFPWLFVALGLGAVILGVSFVLSLLFAGATVTVYPKQETVSVTADLSATLSSGVLPFERMSLDRSTETMLVALKEERVEERASGRITIYNDHSETPQRLIKNTRFASPDGRIYRIRESVEVPGKKASGPGTIEVAVYAEEPGEEYNRGPTEFTVPGFVGMPQEGKVYGRSTGDITGGFDGTRRTLDEQERNVALSQMETKLRDELLAAAFGDAAKPDGYVLYKDAVYFDFQPAPDRYEGSDKVIVSLKGTLHGILLREDALAKEIARVTIAGYTGDPVRIDNPDDLVVRMVRSGEPEEPGTTDTTVAPWTADNLTAAVSGKARLIWLFDAEQLAGDLAGRDKEAMYATGPGGILAGYPGIDRAEATVRPFWKKAFPEEVADIKIVTVLDS